jgi:hypothetical protein
VRAGVAGRGRSENVRAHRRLPLVALPRHRRSPTARVAVGRAQTSRVRVTPRVRLQRHHPSIVPVAGQWTPVRRVDQLTARLAFDSDRMHRSPSHRTCVRCCSTRESIVGHTDASRGTRSYSEPYRPDTGTARVASTCRRPEPPGGPAQVLPAACSVPACRRWLFAGRPLPHRDGGGRQCCGAAAEMSPASTRRSGDGDGRLSSASNAHRCQPHGAGRFHVPPVPRKL